MRAAVFQNHTAAFVHTWQTLAFSPGNATFFENAYNQTGYSMMYNLYADRLLGTDLISATVRKRGTVCFPVF